MELSTRWIRSRFSNSSGSQNEWLTSRVVRLKRTVESTGNTRTAGSWPAAVERAPSSG